MNEAEKHGEEKLLRLLQSAGDDGDIADDLYMLAAEVLKFASIIDESFAKTEGKQA